MNAPYGSLCYVPRFSHSNIRKEISKFRFGRIINITPLREFKYNCTRNSPSVLFDIYDTSYTMDLEDFTTACKLPQWGNINDPHKSKFRDFLASITVGESRDIAQATIGSIHFPAIHYFALFIGRCINSKDEACHMCVPDLCVLKSAVLGYKDYNLGQ